MKRNFLCLKRNSCFCQTEFALFWNGKSVALLNKGWTRVNVHFVNHDHATDKNNDHFSYWNSFLYHKRNTSEVMGETSQMACCGIHKFVDSNRHTLRGIWSWSWTSSESSSNDNACSVHKKDTSPGLEECGEKLLGVPAALLASSACSFSLANFASCIAKRHLSTTLSSSS